MSLAVTQIYVNGYDKNFAYLVTNVDTKETAIVDPSGEVERIFQVVAERRSTVTTVLITHTDHDHINQLGAVLERYGNLPIYVHEQGVGRLGLGEGGVGRGAAEPLRADDTVSIGKGEVTVLYTPGHIDDAVCFYIPTSQAADGVPKLIAGDTLFVEGCGRTTAHDVTDLYESLQTLKALPKETVVYPGHDYGPTPTSTLAHELTHNRFMLAPNLERFTKERLG